jgi:uronate dehydrogenase
MMQAKKEILITGAGGMIAPDLVERLQDDYDIRLSDIQPVETPHKFIRADLADPVAVAQAVSGVQAIVHLGAITWDQDVLSAMIPSNIIGTYNIFEQGRKAGVQRIVFASSHHTVAYYHEDGILNLNEDLAPRPDTFYAVTKLYGEALARLYHERYDLRTYCLRIGYYMTAKRISEGFGRYKEALILSPDDFAQMVRLCLMTEESFGLFNCISKAHRPWLSTQKAQEILGYRPTGTVESLFGDLPPAEDLTPEDFAWMHGVLDKGPERSA